ncbi:dihydrolipoamide acetyltransferase family protein [Hoeflea alexandrii]|uniref:Dihydrolipoamide acetyltransferase component of pyruvate dehydrogenase complex n=1 Tax=Hoeflea alexandrii TaxID=288436 RepID=A0ABT1CTW8_9HYPH|nr:dihydrolipoamide acetyltransferase family protein [Hoeflea alexandrii]MCO6409653.1 2-oxo acid dehydrogenase subunit E2 [Hoeflea alexandrii]
MSVFVMPSLGADMEDGKLVEWLVKPGDAVHRGDVVAVVETQKGAIEIEIFEDGIVQSLEAELGATLPVGATLALIGDATAAAAPELKPEPKPAPPPVAARQAAPAEPQSAEAKPEPDPQPAPVKVSVPEPQPVTVEAKAPLPATPEPETLRPKLAETLAARHEIEVPPSSAPIPLATGTGSGVAASPAARALAAEKGIDLAGVTGSWPGGAIVLADVERAAAGTAEAPAPRTPPAKPARGFDVEAMRQGIAAAMTRSKREIPHYYMTHEVDLQQATDWLARMNANVAPADRLLMGALFVKATALAAKQVDGLNGHFDKDGFTRSETVNAGVAVALRGGGLVAPAIPAADRLSLAELMAAMRDVVARARAGRLRSSEMTSGTITISSLGDRGVDQMTGVIYPPQVALVTFGTPRAMARVLGDSIQIRQAVAVTLAADHRASDGRRGARFLTEIDKLLQSPEAL